MVLVANELFCSILFKLRTLNLLQKHITLNPKISLIRLQNNMILYYFQHDIMLEQVNKYYKLTSLLSATVYQTTTFTMPQNIRPSTTTDGYIILHEQRIKSLGLPQILLECHCLLSSGKQ